MEIGRGRYLMKRSKVLIIVIILMLAMTSCTNNKEAIENTENIATIENVFEEKEVKITVDKAKDIIEKEEDLLILDTRTEEEYDAGHIEGAILIPHDQLAMNLDQLKGFEDKPILVYCRSGNRSTIAVNTLIQNGFNKIYHMNQGFSKWK